VVAVDPGVIWVWMEDVAGEASLPWTLEDHVDLARRVGVFNGQGLGDGEGADPVWFSRRWLRGWVDANAAAIDRFAEVRNMPWVQRTWPGAVGDALLSMWAEREQFLTAVEALPQSFAHLDVFCGNVVARRDGGGAREVVLFDWAFAGRAAVGEELAPLVLANTAFGVVPGDVDTFERLALAAYLEGLRQTGWAGDERLVMLGYTAAGALRYGVGLVNNWLPFATQDVPQPVAERLLGRPFAEAVDLVSTVGQRALGHLARQSRTIMSALDLE
jgi:hypothetical protein